MSVLIKGMEMPKNCAECKFLCSENFKSWCHVTDRDDVYVDAVPDWCPLAELPEKHGRLIDESIVLEMIRKSMGIKDLSFLYNAEKSVVNEIYHAPTVIEAEGE